MIIVGFNRGSNWVAALIRWFTGSEWIHCWIEYPSQVWGGDWIAHAEERGVIKVPAETVMPKWGSNIRRYQILPDVSKGLEAARLAVGKRYDWMSLIGHAIRLLAHKITGGSYGNPSRNAARLTCSEFVAIILKASGVDGTEAWDVESITPSDIEWLCVTSSQFKRIIAGVG